MVRTHTERATTVPKLVTKTTVLNSVKENMRERGGRATPSRGRGQANRC